MSETEKPILTEVFRHNPATSEGKYLVKRRDGTIPEWPWFVLGAADPAVPMTLRFYAAFGFFLGLFTFAYVRSVWRFAGEMAAWRQANRTGDPGRGKHRIDDPATIAEMRKGQSA